MDKTRIKKELNVFRQQSIGDILVENKEYIYPALFYIAGLLLGSFLFSYSNPLSEIMKSFFTITITDITSLFFNRFALYISIYSLTVLFGMCLIGFPFINFIPLAVGVEIAMKISFYYVTYSFKGIGYALLMLAPECAAFVTILIYTIKMSAQLSKNIYSLAVKKTDTSKEIILKTYLKSFAFYALFIALIALVNTLATYLLGAIIKI